MVDLCADVSCDVDGAACDAADGSCKCTGGEICETDCECTAEGVARRLPPERCATGSRWSAGSIAFRDATADWGLDTLAVEGTRLAVGDVNGDGRADLFVRRGGNGADDFSDGGVRRSWLLVNQGDRFEDVTDNSWVRLSRINGELSYGRQGEVVAFADVDNDGDQDVYTGMQTMVDGALNRETSELMLNDGSPRFLWGPETSDLRRVGETDAVAAASFVDFDRDGNIDIWTPQHNFTARNGSSITFQPDFLYAGDGTGSFSDVSTQLGLTTVNWTNIDEINQGQAHSRAWASAACDLNNDGSPELLAASYGRAPNHLWQARIDPGTRELSYENRSVASGYAYDENQVWQDNEFARCYCQANRAAEGCDQVGAPRIQCGTTNWSHTSDRQAFRLGGNSGTTVCADVNNDGHLDLFTTEITHWWAGGGADRSELLVNSGEEDVRFERPGEAMTGLNRTHSSVSWDQGDITAAVFDFDNDGWPDVFVGATDYPDNRALLYHQATPLSFEPVPIAEGIDHFRSHGIAVADFDQDGDLDIVLGHSRARCGNTGECNPTSQVKFFENLSTDANWIQVDLEGIEGTNRSAIGARITVESDGLTQTQEVGGGHGHYGMQHDMVRHFGLGPSCEATVTVRWPNADLTVQSQVLRGGYRYTWKQGEEPVAVTD